jgi:hypothetical protein
MKLTAEEYTKNEHEKTRVASMTDSSEISGEFGAGPIQ